MREHYDFSKARRNPYVKRLKRQVTIRLDQDTIDYFKSLSADSGIPYQTLINLYLRDCAANRKRVAVLWQTPADAGGRQAPADAGGRQAPADAGRQAPADAGGE